MLLYFFVNSWGKFYIFFIFFLLLSINYSFSRFVGKKLKKLTKLLHLNLLFVSVNFSFFFLIFLFFHIIQMLYQLIINFGISRKKIQIGKWWKTIFNLKKVIFGSYCVIVPSNMHICVVHIHNESLEKTMSTPPSKTPRNRIKSSN